MIRYDPLATPVLPEQEGRSATKTITFYRNGDKHFKGVTLPVNRRHFRQWDTLLKYLAEKILLPYGVRHVYDLGGERVDGLAELEDGRAYVCASGQFAKNVAYGRAGDTSRRPWQNNRPGEGSRGSDLELYDGGIRPARSWNEAVNKLSDVRVLANHRGTIAQPRVKPRAIVIISNTHRESRASILLNPRTSQSFDRVLEDMSPAIQMSSPPVKQLFTWRTEEPVLSFTQLFRYFKNHYKFIACGLEPLNRTALYTDSSPDRSGDYTNGGGRGGNRSNGRKWRKANRKSKARGGAFTISRRQEAEDLSSTPQSSLDDHSPRLPPLEARRAIGSSGDHNYRNQDPNRRSLPVEVEPREAEIGDSNYRAEDGMTEGVLHLEPRKKKLAPPVSVEIRGKMRHFLPPTINSLASHHQTDTDNSSGQKPHGRLKLNWVYGYHGFKHRNNLFVLSSGELLYHVGAVAVLLDEDAGTQRHYTGHNEEIQSMAIHPSGTHVATGQIAGELLPSTPRDIAMCYSAHIRVWEVESLHTHAILGLEFFDVGVACLSFSTENDGEWLLAVDQGDNPTLSVWEWGEDAVLTKTKEYFPDDTAPTKQAVGKDSVYVGSFHPLDDSVIVTAGRQHLFVWKLVRGRILRSNLKTEAVDDDDDSLRAPTVTCLEFSQTGDILTGDSTGNITVREKDHEGVFQVRHCIQHAHERGVSALTMLEDGTLLSAGSLDRRLQAWDSIRGYRSAQLEKTFTEHAGSICAIAPAYYDGPSGGLLGAAAILLGTTRNHIMEGSLQTKFVYVMQSHCGELRALSPHPTEQAFATAGLDQTVMLWQAESHKLLWKSEVEKPCASCGFHPSASVLAVGTIVGRLTVLNAYDGTHIASIQVGNEQLNAVQYSPDGNLLVLCSHDHNIYLLSVIDDGQVYRKTGLLRGHSNHVIQIDWSVDGCYLQSVSGNYDIKFWNVAEKTEKKAEIVRDVTWKTQTCVVGHPVLGIWAGREPRNDVTTVDRSPVAKLLAVGDSLGVLSLYKYPCASTKALPYDVKQHSSHVTNVRFLADDSYVVSTGGTDAVVMQWSIVGEGNHYTIEDR